MEIIRRKMGCNAGRNESGSWTGIQTIVDLRKSPAIEFVKILQHDGAVLPGCEEGVS